MEPYLNNEDQLNLDTIPPLLAYHLLFVDVMASCTVGRLNITTVEAKVQSVFYFHDVIESVLHPGTILFAKIRLARFIFNAVIEVSLTHSLTYSLTYSPTHSLTQVEMMIPGLEQDEGIWKLLASFMPYLQQSLTVLKDINLYGLGTGYNRLIVEYSMVAVMIVSGFFGRYYDPAFFKFTEKKESVIDPLTGVGVEVEPITSSKSINIRSLTLLTNSLLLTLTHSITLTHSLTQDI